MVHAPSAASRVDGMATATVNGTRLAYVDRGAGQPVVLVHGGINDWRTWDAQLPVLSERFRVIAYSRRYAWPNQPIPDGVDDQMMPHVDDLIALVRALDLGPVHLVGNSWGAFICLRAALREPDLVRTLTLEEPPVIPLFFSTPPRIVEWLRVFATRPRTGIAVLKFLITVFGPSVSALKQNRLDDSVRIFAEGVLGKQRYAALPETFKEQIRVNAKTHAAQFLGKGFSPLSDEDVRHVNRPTLLVTGQDSPPWFLRLTDRLAELLPIVERVEIPDASHVMHAQNPAALNRALLAFLAKHRS